MIRISWKNELENENMQTLWFQFLLRDFSASFISDVIFIDFDKFHTALDYTDGLTQ